METLDLFFLREGFATNYATDEFVKFGKLVDEQRNNLVKREVPTDLPRSIRRAKHFSFKTGFGKTLGSSITGLATHSQTFENDLACAQPQHKSMFYRSLRYDNCDLEANYMGRYSVSDSELQKDLERYANSDFDWLELENIKKVHSALVIHRDSKPLYDKQITLTVNEALEEKLRVTTSICVGYPRGLRHHEVRLGRLFKVAQELQFTGNHTLYDVKKMISCCEDYAYDQDFTDRYPRPEDASLCKYPSSFFFIDDVFYYDETVYGSEQFALLVREFVAQRFKSTEIYSMQKTRLADIRCRLGNPYLFVHQGRCEHLLVFKSLHTASRFDKKSLEDYPICMFRKNFKPTVCNVCEEPVERIVVMDNQKHASTTSKPLFDHYMLDDSPYFLCETCFVLFTLDTNGRKVFPFISTPYLDRNAIA